MTLTPSSRCAVVVQHSCVKLLTACKRPPTHTCNYYDQCCIHVPSMYIYSQQELCTYILRLQNTPATAVCEPAHGWSAVAMHNRLCPHKQAAWAAQLSLVSRCSTVAAERWLCCGWVPFSKAREMLRPGSCTCWGRLHAAPSTRAR